MQFNSMYVKGPIIWPKKTHNDEFNRMNHMGFPTYDSPCMNPQGLRTNAAAQVQLARPDANAANQVVNPESPEQRRLRHIRETEGAQDEDPEYPTISYDLLTWSQGISRRGNLLLTMVNGVPTRVVGAPENLDMVIPMPEINKPEATPRNREPLRQPQFDVDATLTSTGPQNWGSRIVEVEDKLRELRDEVHPSPSNNPRVRGSHEVMPASSCTADTWHDNQGPSRMP
jgi:hypothetical protein